MNVIPRMSLNFNARPALEPISTLVLHYTGMKTADEALLRLCDPVSQVSSHYVVDEDGTIYQLVEEEMRAWHAGVSHWRGRDNLNDVSIGIEIVNPGHEFGYRPFPAVQMEAVATLCRDILDRHPAIEARNVVGHSDIAPERKEDPGELFDWEWLAAQGVGVFPAPGPWHREPVNNPRIPAFDPCLLSTYGYSIENQQKSILAFQRHFRPSALTGSWDAQCEAILAKLLEMI